MILRGYASMGGASASSRRGPARLAPARTAIRLRPTFRPDPNLGGMFGDFVGAVGGAVHSAIDTTVSSVSIPLQTISAVAQGNYGAVPGLLHQAINTIPLVSHVLPGGSQAAAPATASSTATLQDQAAAATQGLTPGTPQYTAALQAAGLVPAAPASNLPLYLGGAGVLLAVVLLLRPRPAQS